MAELKSQDLSPSPAGSNPLDPTPDLAQGTDALAHLARMSGTGSSFGAEDYVAINSTAIGSLILGFASALALLVSAFLILPALGILFGVVAISQIRQSNGTQGGYGLAIAGLTISLLLGGFVSAVDARNWMVARAQTEQCAVLLSKFGQHVSSGNYRQAYQLTSEGFRARVSPEAFRATFEQLQGFPAYGHLESITWNGSPMTIDALPDGEFLVTQGALLKFQNLVEPSRQEARITGHDQSWKIEKLPQIFPDQKPKGPGI